MKEKAYNSRGREKDELTQALKSYSDYAFPNDETCLPRELYAFSFMIFNYFCRHAFNSS